jgi:outer membrane immunogenic protein
MFSKFSSSALLTALLLGVLPATAADAQDSRWSEPYAPAPASEWTGFYAGVHGGLAPKASDFNIFKDSSLLGGVQAGYTMQFGPAVIGAELEGTYAKGIVHSVGAGELEQNWSGAAKVRGGLALGGTLVYATGGYAVARLDAGNNVISDDKWVGGMLWGAGLEQSFGNGLSARVEYTQTRFNDVDSTLIGNLHRTDDLTNHAVKAGLNFRF